MSLLRFRVLRYATFPLALPFLAMLYVFGIATHAERHGFWPFCRDYLEKGGT